MKNAATPKADVHHGAKGVGAAGVRSDALGDAVIATVAVALGLTTLGLTVHVTPGTFELHDRSTLPLKPFSLCNVTMALAEVPADSVIEGLKNNTLKSAVAVALQLETRL